MMEAIEPYDYEDLKEFNLSYLSGYMADKYDQEPDELTDTCLRTNGAEVLQDRLLKEAVKGYETVTTEDRRKITVTKKGTGKIWPVSGVVSQYKMEWTKHIPLR